VKVGRLYSVRRPKRTSCHKLMENLLQGEYVGLDRAVPENSTGPLQHSLTSHPVEAANS
jgi:hypothetical protein